MLVGKKLVGRKVAAADARRARVTLTPEGRALHDEIFPQVAAINRQLVSVLDDATAQALDAALTQLTEHAQRLNEVMVRDVRADRRSGGSRRLRRADDEGA